MSRRFWRRTALALALLVALPPAALLAVLGSDDGTRWLLREALSRSAEDWRLEAVRGDLLSRLEIDGLRWEASGTTLALERAVFEWRPTALLGGLLHVVELSVAGVDLTVPPAEEAPEEEPAEPAGLPQLPIAIRIDRVQVDGVDVAAGDTEFRLDAARLATRIDGSRVHLETLAASAPGWRVEASGEVDAVSPYPFDGRVDWQAELPDVGTVSGGGDFAGDLAQVRFQHRLGAPLAIELDGRINLDGPASSGRVVAVWEPFALAVGGAEWRSGGGELRLQGGASDLALSLHGDVSGPGVELEQAELNVTGSVRIEPPHAMNLALAWRLKPGAEPAVLSGAPLAGGGSISGDLDRLRVDHTLSEPFRLGTRVALGLAATPMGIELDGDWREARWPLAGAAEFRSERGDVRAEGDLDHLDFTLGAVFEALAAGLTDGRVDLDGGADLGAPNAFDARLDWSFMLPDGVPAAGAGRFNGDLAAIDLEHSVTAPLVLATRGRVRPDSENELLDIEGEWRGARWPLAGDQTTVTSERGRYSVRGGLASLRASVEAALGGDAVPLADAGLQVDSTLDLSAGVAFDARLGWQGALAEGVDVRASGRASGDAERVEFEHTVEQPFTVETRGNVALAGEAPRFEVSGGWREARWPLAGESPDYASERGELEVSGTPENYRLTLAAALDGAALPPAEANLQATGGSAAARIGLLRLTTLGGEARLTGDVGWAPEVSFDLRLEGENINPGAQWAEWPGRLGFEIAADGRLAENGPEVRVERLRADGELRGYPLQADGSARMAGSRAEVPMLTLRSGDNRLELSGSVAEEVALDFTLAAPDMAGLWPGLAGSAAADGEVRGPLTAPRVAAEASIDRLRYEGNAIARLDLDARLDLAGGDASRIELSLADALLGGEPVASLRLSGRGGPAEHSAELVADANLADLSLALRGGLRDDAWRGRLERLEVGLAEGEPWSLLAPATLRASAQSQALERLCLGQGAASICAAFTKSAEQTLDGSLEVAALPLMVAAPWLPPGIALEGTLEATGRVSGTSGAPRATLAVTPPPGALTWQTLEGEPLRVDWSQLRVDARYVEDRVDAEARIDLREVGSVSADLRLGSAAEDGDRSLAGRVDAKVDDLALVAAFAPALHQPQGVVDVALALDGSVARPKVSGSATLADGAVQVPDAGLTVTDIRLAARNRGEEVIEFDGGMRSGEGTLELAGEVSLDAGQGFPVAADIKGERFEVSRLPIAHVYASPDLRVERGAELTRVSGTLLIPTAHFRLRELPVSAVPVSDDEVVVQERREEPEPPAPVVVDITLQLGDDVHFSGFGLDTGLAGRLRVSSAPGEAPLGEGALQLEKGTYKAYGQDLSIERGRLLFAGPMDNPGLDVRATRAAGDVTAGLLVTGTASKPRAEVFSQPPLPDADAFSYLLTGRPLSGASASEGSMLASAALALGIDNADVLTKKIGRQLGLDEVGITGDGQGAGLVLGKYLTPDIYLSYVLGLIGEQGGVQLEYRLTDRIRLQGASGTDSQSVDLLYRYERQ